MKSDEGQCGSVTEPLLRDLIDQHKSNAKLDGEKPSTGSKPLDPPAHYQDAGGGYNSNFTFPQE